MQKKTLIVWAVIIGYAVFLGGFTCPALASDNELVKPDKGYGMVYVVRSFGQWPQTKYHIYLDKAEGKDRIGYTQGGEYINFQVEPGKHELISVANNIKSIPFEIKSGETIFILQVERIDIDGTNQYWLEIMPPDVGKYYVSHSTKGWVDKKHTR